MKSLLFVSLLFLSACSTGWSTRHTTIQAYGIYAVHPMYGVLGLGYIDYERKPGGIALEKVEPKEVFNETKN